MEKTERKEANEKNGNGKKNSIERARCYTENSLAQLERMKDLEIMELQVRKLAENNLPYTPENIKRIEDTDYQSKVKDIRDRYDNLAALYKKNIEEIGVLEGKIKAYNLFIQDQKTKFNERTGKLSALAEGLKLYVSGREKEFNSHDEELDKVRKLIRNRLTKITGLRARIVEKAKDEVVEYVNKTLEDATNSAADATAKDIRRIFSAGRDKVIGQINNYFTTLPVVEGAEAEVPESVIAESKPEDKTKAEKDKEYAQNKLKELESVITLLQTPDSDILDLSPV